MLGCYLFPGPRSRIIESRYWIAGLLEYTILLLYPLSRVLQEELQDAATPKLEGSPVKAPNTHNGRHVDGT